MGSMWDAYCFRNGTMNFSKTSCAPFATVRMAISVFRSLPVPCEVMHFQAFGFVQGVPWSEAAPAREWASTWSHSRMESCHTQAQLSPERTTSTCMRPQDWGSTILKWCLERFSHHISCSITASAVSIAEKTTQYVSHCSRACWCGYLPSAVLLTNYQGYIWSSQPLEDDYCGYNEAALLAVQVCLASRSQISIKAAVVTRAYVGVIWRPRSHQGFVARISRVQEPQKVGEPEEKAKAEHRARSVGAALNKRTAVLVRINLIFLERTTRKLLVLSRDWLKPSRRAQNQREKLGDLHVTSTSCHILDLPETSLHSHTPHKRL